jgi:oligopeptide/dipeptide ABC transporter ATP-binding protein
MTNSNSPTLISIKDLKVWFPIRRGILTRTVGYVKAVDGISVDIGKGETLGLVGESGCGKTTLGRALLQLEKIHAGQIWFDDNDLRRSPQQQMKQPGRRMQMIFQDPISSLNPRMNVMNIITEGLIEFDLLESDKRTHAVRLLQEVGLSKDVLERYPHEFSGGQRQRISIARALSVKPDFIVCDEAVSALDVSVQAQIVNLLIDLKERYHMSYLFISHDLSVVSHIADRIAVMYLGKIVEYGDKRNMIENPLHPYTKALVEAVPQPGVAKKREILKGEMPSAIHPPQGCRFSSRCPFCMEVCRVEAPVATRIGTRTVYCHLYHG